MLNPHLRLALRLGTRTFALLETVGRRSGKPRRTPVGNGLIGNTFWLVCEHGSGAGYVRNIEANPRVRVKIGRRWRTGSAHIAEQRRPLRPPRPCRWPRRSAGCAASTRAIFRFFVRRLGTEPVTGLVK